MLKHPLVTVTGIRDPLVTGIRDPLVTGIRIRDPLTRIRVYGPAHARAQVSRAHPPVSVIVAVLILNFIRIPLCVIRLPG